MTRTQGSVYYLQQVSTAVSLTASLFSRFDVCTHKVHRVPSSSPTADVLVDVPGNRQCRRALPWREICACDVVVINGCVDGCVYCAMGSGGAWLNRERRCPEFVCALRTRSSYSAAWPIGNYCVFAVCKSFICASVDE